MGPLGKTGIITDEANLWLALVLGFFFGFVLQRLGFTHGTKIGRIFYLRDVDVAVGMFTAIVTGMLGLWGMFYLGLIDVSKFYFLPTYLAPMAVGGLIFGVGMVVGGYCPGTGIASAFTGKIDALVYVVGFFLGTMVFGDLFPIWEDFYGADFRGTLRLDELFGWDLGPTILFVTLASVLGMWGFRCLERRIWGAGAVCAVHLRDRIPTAVAVVAALAIALVPTEAFFSTGRQVGSVAGWERPDARQPVFLDPLAFGRTWYDNADRVLCLDLRAPEQFAAGHLPGAVSTSLDGIYALQPPPGALVLLCGGETRNTREALEVLWRDKGVRAYAAAGDYAALERWYLRPLTPELVAELGDARAAELRTYRTLFAGPDADADRSGSGAAELRPDSPSPR
jgi:uncharacterized membrane protein YedE/YeeE/rhodanese-related sulfurtransferase